MTTLLSTKAVAEKLGVNEKMVYSLIAEKGLPASKVTGKWLFPEHLVDAWVEANTINAPEAPWRPAVGVQNEGDGCLLIGAGSNDLLLERALAAFHAANPDIVPVYGPLGSMGGLKALRRGLAHFAASHLLQDDGEYNFAFAQRELERSPAVVNFCRREQGLLLPPGNPAKVAKVADLAGKTVVNRTPGTGTRLLFDKKLAEAGVDVSTLDGYEREAAKHLDAGLEVLAGRAEAAPGIRAVAGLLGLDFLSLGFERFDLLIPKDRYFERPVQAFLGYVADKAFSELAATLKGYDVEQAGRVLFPAN